MAATQPCLGIDHLTVVPAPTVADDDEDDDEDQSDVERPERAN